MKKSIRFLAFFLAVALLIPIKVNAAGSTSISISNKNPNAGENFTVTISATESGQMTISYDSRIINIIGSTLNGQSTSNSLTVNGSSVTLTFSAISPGSSGVVVSSPTLAGSSINVPVGGTATNEQTAEEAPAPSAPAPEPEAASPEQEPIGEASPEPPAADMPEGDLTIDGVNYLVSERYPDSVIPKGFVESVVTINSKGFRQLTNGVLLLLYLKRSDNPDGDGTFFLYDETTGEASPLRFLGTMDEYVIIKDPRAPFSSALEPVTLEINGFVHQLYKIAGAESDFYYMYGVNEDMAESWYAYDSLTSRISRADVGSLSLIKRDEEDVPAAIEPIDEEKEEPQKLFGLIPLSKELIIGVAAFLGILIVVIIINVALRKRERRYDDDDDYYEEDYDEDDYEYEDEDEEEYNERYARAEYKYKDMIEESKDSFDEATEVLSDDVIYESDNFDIRVKELNVPDVYETGPQDRKESEARAGEELLDDIIRKAGSRKNIDIMDLDDL